MHTSMTAPCTHLDQIKDVTPSAQGCEECLICGHVGWCDSSKNTHATTHFHATTHPLIRSFQPGEDWLWCYVDQVMMEPSS